MIALGIVWHNSAREMYGKAVVETLSEENFGVDIASLPGESSKVIIRKKSGMPCISSGVMKAVTADME